jgi:hypothetical protein
VRVRRWTCECIMETGGGPEGPGAGGSMATSDLGGWKETEQRAGAGAGGGGRGGGGRRPATHCARVRYRPSQRPSPPAPHCPLTSYIHTSRDLLRPPNAQPRVRARRSIAGVAASFFTPRITCAVLRLPPCTVRSPARPATGVAGGATRAALTQHFARRGNAADVSAKEQSQARSTGSAVQGCRTAAAMRLPAGWAQ